MATKKSKFVIEGLKDVDKTEKQLLEDKIQNFVEEAIIECEMQIALLETGEIPKATMKVSKAKLALKKAENAYEKSRTQYAENFTSYVYYRNQQKGFVQSFKEEVSIAESNLFALQAELAEYKLVLEDLKS